MFIILGLFFAICICFVTIHECDGQTDGRTDIFTIQNNALHAKQCGKNSTV